MLWVPHKGSILHENNMGRIALGATPGTAVTTGAGTAKGTPAQLIAATAFDAYKVVIVAWNYGASGVVRRCKLDLMIGASTEEVIIADMLAGGCGDVTTLGMGPKVWQFPLYIPAGSRLSARAAGSTAATAMRVGIYLWGGCGHPPWRVGTKVTTYGSGATVVGTNVVAGTSETQGAPDNQITASMSESAFAFVPSFQLGNDTTITPVKGFLVGMAAGSDPAEYIGGNHQGYWYKVDTNERMEGPFACEPAYQDLPSGTRLTMECSMSGGGDAVEPEGAIHAVS